MKHPVTLIRGDGTGPELAQVTKDVLDATGVSFDARFSVVVVAFSVAENVSFVAVGLIAATLIVTVAVEVWPEPSVIV